MEKRLKAWQAREMADKSYHYPVLSYKEVKAMITKAALEGRHKLPLPEVNLSEKTVKILIKDGYDVIDCRKAGDIQIPGLNAKGHWTIFW